MASPSRVARTRVATRNEKPPNELVATTPAPMGQRRVHPCKRQRGPRLHSRSRRVRGGGGGGEIERDRPNPSIERERPFGSQHQFAARHPASGQSGTTKRA